jgi:uncharacterized protein (TIGR02246 family)
MNRLVVFLFLCSSLTAGSPDAAIQAVLDQQVAAWNRGDIAGFMEGYDNSEGTIFIGKDITKGWRNVLERYRKSYPTSERMGRLTFSDIEIHSLSPRVALVVGRFHLARPAAEGGDASGIFSLTFRQAPTGTWKIVADHTS